ncbi:MAG: polysulfide reductase NrfD [Deltaproteobacteria bacterium]|nr:polysulfide reductase NrfD [Deltaproteobacteria bacterium]
MDFVFPNDLNVTWSVMIVLYPYITGLVAGAFIVSSLYHVFGRQELKPVARFSLASAFVFLLFAPLPLLIHLGYPERSFNIMITPNFSSAMAGFGYIYTAYLIVVVMEIWFVMRGDFIKRAKGGGLWALVAKVILLFNLHESDETRRADARITKILAAIGIPMACLLHGYVGFLFGSLKANPWWSTPLMFVIFIFSAIVSGIAVLIFHYFIVSRINRWRIDQPCVRSMGKYLWGFMIVAVSLELLEVMSVAYKQTEEWEVIHDLINHHLFYSYVVVQFLLLSVVPFGMLATTALVRMRDSINNTLLWMASTMLLGQVLLMRWNVVVGGQMLSKSMRGFTSYFPGIWEKEGIAVAVIVFTTPFFLLWLFHRFVPLFPGVEKKA